MKNRSRRTGHFARLAVWLQMWLILSFFLTFVLLPYSEIHAQRYFHFQLYYTLLIILQKTFLKALFLGSAVTFVFALSVFFISLSKKRNRQRFFEKVRHRIAIRIVSLFVLLTGVALNAAVFIFSGTKGPNVVLFVIDTLRSDFTSLGMEGNSYTPVLERELQPDSIVFSNAYSNSPWTLPSISSLLTSQYPSHIDVNNLISRLEDSHLTLAEVLHDHGYFTAGIVSHLLLEKKYGLSQGFRIYNEDNISTEYFNHNSISSPGVTNKAIQMLQKHKRNKFFLFLHYFDPHYTYINHNSFSDYSGEFTSRDISYLRDLIRKKQYSEADLDYLRESYASEITFTDTYVGEVIQTLKNEGLYDKTLIIFTADHGEEFVEKGWLGHSTTVFNEQIKIPMLIKLPASKSSRPLPSKEMCVSNIDIAPSVLDILGIPVPPLFQGETVFFDTENPRFVFSEVIQRDYGDLKNRVCVIGEGWKLIYDAVTQHYELYNLRENRSETNNLLGADDDIERSFKMKIAKWIDTNRTQPARAKRREALTEEERQKLRSLGYLK